MKVRVVFAIKTLFVVSSVLASACANVSITKYDSYSIVPMEISECSPDKVNVYKGKTVVSVPKFDDSGLNEDPAKQLSRKANLAAIMSSRVASMLAEAGIEPYNGEERQKKPIKDLAIKKELTTNQEPPVQVNYVVMGYLDAVEANPKYEREHEQREYGVAGKKKRIGPKCRYTAIVKGNIRIYNDEKRALGNIEFSASRFLLEDARSAQCTLGGNVVTLVRETAETAIRDAKTRLQKFCPPVGYVLEKRTNGKESIYKISIGESMGMKPGTDARVFRKYIFKNPLTEETVKESRIVAKGKVTDQLGSNYSWIRLADETNLQLGDEVSAIYEDSMLHKIGVGR